MGPGWLRVGLVVLLVGMGSGYKKGAGVADEVPGTSVVDSLIQAHPRQAQVFETLYRMGYGKTAIYHVFLHSGVREVVRDTLGPERFDSLMAWIGEPDDSTWDGYLWRLDSLLVASRPRVVDTFYTSYRSRLLSRVLHWLEKLPGVVRRERPSGLQTTGGEHCYWSDQTGFTMGRSTVGRVVSCVDWSLWSRVYAVAPDQFKREIIGRIGLSQTRISVIDILGRTDCPGGGNTCLGWLVVHQRWLNDVQDPRIPDSSRIVYTGSEAISLALPVAVILPAIGAVWGGWAGAIVGALIGAAGALSPPYIRIDRYEALSSLERELRDLDDFFPNQPPLADELTVEWTITLERMDTGALLVSCAVSKTFRSDVGATDPGHDLGYCRLKKP